MLARVQSFVLQGIEPAPCEVEVDVATSGLPKTTVVGLPDTAVKESAERVRSAMINSGYGFPDARILIGLAPADTQKTGPVYDLPIAVGLLRARGEIRTDDHADLLFAGELALDGRLRPVSGIINLALLARRTRCAGVVVPAGNAAEASAVRGVKVYAAGTLGEVVGFLNGQHLIDATAEPDLDDDLYAAGTTLYSPQKPNKNRASWRLDWDSAASASSTGRPHLNLALLARRTRCAGTWWCNYRPGPRPRLKINNFF